MTDTAALGLYGSSHWRDVPKNILLGIFSYLVNHEDLYHAGLTCGRWYEASKDDLLWKNLTKRKWGIDDEVSIRPEACSWRDEYKRLFYHSPSVPFVTLSGHKASVEHVSSSNRGKYFATCSRDSTVRVWELEKPFRLKYMADLTIKLVDTIMSKFNENDSMLLVACLDKKDNRTSIGKTIIFDVMGKEMRKLRSISYSPWTMLSDWYDGDSFIYGVFKRCQSISFYKCIVKNNVPCHGCSTSMSGLVRPGIRDSIRLCKLSACRFDSIKFIRTANISRIATYNECLIFFTTTGNYNNKVNFKSLNDDKIQEDRPMADIPDYTLELNGPIGGLALNQEHTLLYINFLEPKPSGSSENILLDNFTVHVVDMNTKTIIHKISPGHKSILPRNPPTYPFTFLDVSRLYLASASMDAVAYLWELHYGVQVARLLHQQTDVMDGVNCVAFSHIDLEVLLSVSDKTITIWASLNYLCHTAD